MCRAQLKIFETVDGKVTEREMATLYNYIYILLFNQETYG